MRRMSPMISAGARCLLVWDAPLRPESTELLVIIGITKLIRVISQFRIEIRISVVRHGNCERGGGRDAVVDS
jgi:hypothetical protein